MGIYGSHDEGRMLPLLGGAQSDRESPAVLLGLPEDPAQLPTLAALALDPSPIVRSGAAEALDQVHELLNDLL
jgi:HEAT repeat protein